MSVIHLGHIKNSILERFGNLIDLADVQTAQLDQKETRRLTRGLAAFRGEAPEEGPMIITIVPPKSEAVTSVQAEGRGGSRSV